MQLPPARQGEGPELLVGAGQRRHPPDRPPDARRACCSATSITTTTPTAGRSGARSSAIRRPARRSSSRSARRVEEIVGRRAGTRSPAPAAPQAAAVRRRVRTTTCWATACRPSGWPTCARRPRTRCSTWPITCRRRRPRRCWTWRPAVKPRSPPPRRPRPIPSAIPTRSAASAWSPTSRSWSGRSTTRGRSGPSSSIRRSASFVERDYGGPGAGLRLGRHRQDDRRPAPRRASGAAAPGRAGAAHDVLRRRWRTRCATKLQPPGRQRAAAWRSGSTCSPSAASRMRLYAELFGAAADRDAASSSRSLLTRGRRSRGRPAVLASTFLARRVGARSSMPGSSDLGGVPRRRPARPQDPDRRQAAGGALGDLRARARGAGPARPRHRRRTCSARLAGHYADGEASAVRRSSSSTRRRTWASPQLRFLAALGAGAAGQPLLRRRPRPADLPAAVLVEGARRRRPRPLAHAAHQLPHLAPDPGAGRPAVAAVAGRRRRQRREPEGNDLGVQRPAAAGRAVRPMPNDEAAAVGRWIARAAERGRAAARDRRLRPLRRASWRGRGLPSSEAGPSRSCSTTTSRRSRARSPSARCTWRRGWSSARSWSWPATTRSLPLQERIETVADEADLEEVYNTERHLLYVACTRARDQLLVTGVEPASEFLGDLLEERLTQE